MTTTRTRSRDRRDTRSSGAREGAERRLIILVSAGIVLVLLIFAGTATSAGHVVLAASQHFLLKYSGVFALLALTGSVCMGVVATNRIIMTPGHRVLAQAVHRATSFGALAFLIIHIVLEITAKHLEESTTQHVHVLDAFIPFLSQYRTFYMAEGTISSDIIVLLVVTSILRRRFTSSGNAWKWRAIHYSSYAALILGVLHGLLAGRKAIGSFVYWSYGIVILLVALAVLVRILATSLRNRQIVKSAAPLPEPGGTGSMPARAAALGLMGQLTGSMPLPGASRAMPAGTGLRTAMPLAAPYAADQPPRRSRAIAALPDPVREGTAPGRRAPRYEPGYDGPPRYEGAPSPRPSNRTGPQPGHATRSQPAFQTGPMPAYQADGRPPRGTGAQPVYGTGPMPAYQADGRPPRGTGAQPVYGAGSPQGRPVGPQPPYPPVREARHETGAQPAYRPDVPPGRGTGPEPGYQAGAAQSGRRIYGAGPRPPQRTGPQPVYDSGPRNRPAPAHDQAPPYEPGPGYGPPYAGNTGYGPEPSYGPDQDPRYGADGYGPGGGYEPPPRLRDDGYGGQPPSGYSPPGRRRRPPGYEGEYLGPIPQVPSHGGDERR
ncbi:MAG: hypothetical protein ACLPQY_00645 [Streptosporangiaceae bacterium]